MFDGKAFGAEIVGVVKDYVERHLSPVIKRITALEKAIDAMPAPKDGKDADLAQVKELIASAIAALPAPEPGKDADPALVAEIVAETVERAVAALPVPKDGKSVTVDELRPLIDETVSKAVAAIPIPKDGAPGRNGLDVKDLFRADGGRLVAVMSDGSTKELGVFVGKDGEPGKDGRDGFSLSEFDAELMADGRTLLLSFTRGDQSFKVELGIPAMIYRGVFKDGETYERGDTVTWAGSLWHCDAVKITEKPGDGSAAWTLCAKKGRDGRDGEVKEKKSTQPVRVGTPSKGV